MCQIGKKKGAKVIAIAGSDEKCQWLEKDLGVDKALNYKSPSFYDDFKKEVGYLDVFFDNVGGDILNFALTRLNQRARIVLCGAISDYSKRLSTWIHGTAKIVVYTRQSQAKRPVVLFEPYLTACKDRGLHNVCDTSAVLVSPR